MMTQSYLNTLYYLATLLSLEPQTTLSIGQSTNQCTFLLKQTASCFVIHGSSVHVFFRCLENIRSSTTNEIIWETNSKKGANVLCAPNETLVQGTNDANKMW